MILTSSTSQLPKWNIVYGIRVCNPIEVMGAIEQLENVNIMWDSYPISIREFLASQHDIAEVGCITIKKNTETLRFDFGVLWEAWELEELHISIIDYSIAKHIIARFPPQ